MPTDADTIAAGCYAMRVRRLSRKLTRLYEAELRGVGMSAARFNVLVAVATAPGVQASELVAILDIEKSTLSRNLKGLIDDGFVIAAPADSGRGRGLRVTDAGRALIADARPAWDRAQAKAEAALGELASSLLEPPGG